MVGERRIAAIYQWQLSVTANEEAISTMTMTRMRMGMGNRMIMVKVMTIMVLRTLQHRHG